MSSRALRFILTGAALTMLSCVTPRQGAAETFSDPGFVSDLVVTFAPFTLVGMAWAPDGRLLVWQKNGVVRVVKDGGLLPTPFIDLSTNVNTFDDRGFWGLAFHPDFVNNDDPDVTATPQCVAQGLGRADEDALIELVEVPLVVEQPVDRASRGGDPRPQARLAEIAVPGQAEAADHGDHRCQLHPRRARCACRAARGCARR